MQLIPLMRVDGATFQHLKGVVNKSTYSLYYIILCTTFTPQIKG